ncbi:MAG TPA: hypothetical protein VFK02_15420 [Kofleriaceae bacterium]|nr:hypothetical protein [Kofleriaceae bacterium]
MRRAREQTPSAWPGRWSIAVAVGALVIAVTVWWHSTRAPLEAGTRVAPSSAVAPSGPADLSRTPGPTARVAALPPPPVAPYPAGGTAGLATDDPLTAYRKANVYPPTSRPLTRDQLDLLQPNQRHEAMRSTGRGDGVSYLFTADRYFVFGDETLTATLDVRRDGAPIQVAITQAFAAVLDPATHEEHPIPLSFAPTGSLLAATFAPAKLGLARQAAIGMHVEFDYGAERQRAHFDFQYTPARGIPARFTGAFSESIDAGSLVIRAGLDVASPGPYVIDANLFDAADHPVAWSRFKGELAAGTQDAALLFFGKVLVDAGAHGPFHIGQLRGARFVPGMDPDLEQVPPYAGTYTTKPYPTDTFSDAEYDSAEKRRMLELLGNDTSHRGGAGRGDSQGAGSSTSP